MRDRFRGLFVALVSLVLFVPDVTWAASVKAEGGNIVFTDDAGKSVQLTSSGRDQDPKIHPKGEWVYFIRSFEGKFKDEKYVPLQGKKVTPGPLREEIWRVRKDGTNANMLYQAKGSAIDGPDIDFPVYPVHNIQFSPDGNKVYFETQEWVTDFGLHWMNSDGSEEKLLGPGAFTRVVLSARTFDERKKDYKGYLVTSQHRYFLYGGSYDWWYLFTPDLKKEIAPLGEDPAYFTDAGEIKYTDGSEKDKLFADPTERGVMVYPRDIGWESLTKDSLEALQKEVDEGHQPWRMDPALVADVFMGFFYGAGYKEGTPPKAKVAYDGNEATVTIDYLERTHNIVLRTFKKSRSDKSEGGIWVVQWMLIRSNEDAERWRTFSGTVLQ